MSKIRIGILFGGSSEEHPVSVKSAREVANHLDLAKYEPYWIGITKDGEWQLCDGPLWTDGRPAVLAPGGQLLVLDDGKYEATTLDVVLPVLHGKLGEDGAIQGMLELSGVPYAGCDVPSSALCMDKALAYLVVGQAGIATPTFWLGTPDAEPPSYPVFVKPARSGSSFGVTKVDRRADLAAAIEEAGKYDSKVLIEAAVEGSEVGCAVLGNGADLLVGEPDRIRLSHGFFKIHQEDAPETGSENSTITVPADISAEARERVQETAKAVYRALGCRGLARVDLFLLADGSVMLNEVNTFPGLTSYSRYPRMMAAAGMPLSEVLDRLVALAREPR